MRRRDFLRGFGVVSAATTALIAPSVPDADDFPYRGWRVVWSGWREPVNQTVRVGYWVAVRPDRHERPYATTLGVVETAPSATYMFDLSRTDRNAPMDPMLDEPQKFAAAKAWAKQRLLEVLA